MGIIDEMTALTTVEEDSMAIILYDKTEPMLVYQSSVCRWSVFHQSCYLQHSSSYQNTKPEGVRPPADESDALSAAFVLPQKDYGLHNEEYADHRSNRYIRPPSIVKTKKRNDILDSAQ